MISAAPLVAALAVASVAAGLDLDVTDATSIKSAAATIAEGLYVYHNPSSTAGQFNQPQPWYWWLSGNGWNGLLDYTIYTGDTTYQDDLLSALAENVGENYDFAPAAQSGWEANDDQVYWAYNALTALEYNFTALPCVAASGSATDCANSWLALSVNVFDDFVTRWAADAGTCGGGLKWQYDPTASGYYYKNAVTNGGFFQTAARLARYTGNATYASWAAEIWDWSVGVGLVTSDYAVLDGAGDEDGANCSTFSTQQWSYNLATYLHGAANMYAYAANGSDEQADWESRVQALVTTAAGTFSSPFANATGVLYEPDCELTASCSTDQTAFKSSLARWMAKAAVLVPSVSANVTTVLQASAEGAAAACSGYGNSTCGFKWYVGGFDGSAMDFGTELSALEAVQSLLASSAPALAVVSS
ncbi:glycoside hydrolase [Xylariales sp. PMI_506]|nr:glycoside hydrolase [Xylariales sp. PMI_506]